MPKTFFDYFAPDRPKLGGGTQAPRLGSGSFGPPPGPTATAAPTPGGAPLPAPTAPPAPPAPAPVPGAPPAAPPTAPAAPGAPPVPLVVSPQAEEIRQRIDTRVSGEQWQTWIDMGFLDPGCPPGTPFKSERGHAGCFEKPVDCPPGLFPPGPGGGPCVAKPRGTGAGAPGTAPTAPGGAPGAPGAFDYDAFMQMLMPLLQGVYGQGGQASGSYLPGTNTRLDSSLPFSTWYQ